MFIMLVRVLFSFPEKQEWRRVAVLKMEEVEKAEEKLGACDFLARARIPPINNFQLQLQLLLSFRLPLPSLLLSKHTNLVLFLLYSVYSADTRKYPCPRSTATRLLGCAGHRPVPAFLLAAPSQVQRKTLKSLLNHQLSLALQEPSPRGGMKSLQSLTMRFGGRTWLA